MSIRGSWRGAVLVASLAVPAGGLLAQSGSPAGHRLPQSPVFRSGIGVVPITVTVSDRRGNPVTDLTQKDFRIRENGIDREIVGFFPQVLTAGEPSAPLAQIGRAGHTGLERVTRRTFLIVLAPGRIQEPTHALDGAIAFVRDRLLPQDAVAVLAFHRVTAFTTDHAAIATILARYKREHERLSAEIRQHFVTTRLPYIVRTPLPIELDLGLPRHGGPDLPAAIKMDVDRSLFEGVLPSSALRNSADVLLGMDLADPKGDRPYNRQYLFAELLEQLQGLGLTLSDAVLLSGPLKLFAGIEHLRFMEGEKHFVYVGGAPPIARHGDLARVFAARANDARVVVDMVWTGGTSRSGGSGCAPCRDLVELTGGYYTSLEMMEAALAKVDHRSRSSYLLGYVPVNPAQDGQYRHVRVAVARPDVIVSHRHGYFAREEPPLLAVRQQVAATRARTLERFDEHVNDIPLKIDAAFEPATAAASPQVRVEVAVDVSPLGISLEGGHYTRQLDVTILCGGGKGKIVGETRLAWALHADHATFTDWFRNGVKRTLRVPVSGVPQSVKVIVYDGTSDRAGLVIAPLSSSR